MAMLILNVEDHQEELIAVVFLVEKDWEVDQLVVVQLGVVQLGVVQLGVVRPFLYLLFFVFEWVLMVV